MAERDDEELSNRYRALGREEPSAELDAKIIAASRRAAASRPRPGRWMLPLSLAAVIVLSVAVTLQMQHEPAAPEAPAAARPAAPAENAAQSVASPAPEQQGPAAAVPVPGPAAVMGRPSREAADRERFERAAPAAAEERARQLSAEESPQRWLEQIAELRREGRDDEADRRLAEFRRRYPAYRIPEATLERVERR